MIKRALKPQTTKYKTTTLLKLQGLNSSLRNNNSNLSKYKYQRTLKHQYNFTPLSPAGSNIDGLVSKNRAKQGQVQPLTCLLKFFTT